MPRMVIIAKRTVNRATAATIAAVMAQMMTMPAVRALFFTSRISFMSAWIRLMMK
ncbi:MAG: hypothetical protein ACYSXD_11245 [Planctomycetota bacterium]